MILKLTLNLGNKFSFQVTKIPLPKIRIFLAFYNTSWIANCRTTRVTDIVTIPTRQVARSVQQLRALATIYCRPRPLKPYPQNQGTQKWPKRAAFNPPLPPSTTPKKVQLFYFTKTCLSCGQLSLCCPQGTQLERVPFHCSDIGLTHTGPPAHSSLGYRAQRERKRGQDRAREWARQRGSQQLIRGPSVCVHDCGTEIAEAAERER